MTDWNELQKRLDTCAECKKLGSGLIVHCENPPARPPRPRGGELLFISEAPTPEGGFWAPPPVKDDLGQKLFLILHRANKPLPEPHNEASLERFTSLDLFLIQTIKWPLCTSARTLRPAERRLVQHSVEFHLEPELAIIRPSAIIPLGKVACYACGLMFKMRGFNFDHRAKLEDVRGKLFRVKINAARDIPVCPTGLPVKRRAKDIPQITKEIKDALSKYSETKD